MGHGHGSKTVNVVTVLLVMIFVSRLGGASSQNLYFNGSSDGNITLDMKIKTTSAMECEFGCFCAGVHTGLECVRSHWSRLSPFTCCELADTADQCAYQCCTSIAAKCYLLDMTCSHDGSCACSGGPSPPGGGMCFGGANCNCIGGHVGGESGVCLLVFLGLILGLIVLISVVASCVWCCWRGCCGRPLQQAAFNQPILQPMQPDSVTHPWQVTANQGSAPIQPMPADLQSLQPMRDPHALPPSPYQNATQPSAAGHLPPPQAGSVSTPVQVPSAPSSSTYSQQTDLAKWLQSKDINLYLESNLRELGIQAPADLALVTESDLLEAGVTKVQARKILSAAEK